MDRREALSDSFPIFVIEEHNTFERREICFFYREKTMGCAG